MDTLLTLEQVAEKFKNWRASRTKREKIPDNLLAEVAELKKHHKNSHKASPYPQYARGDVQVALGPSEAGLVCDAEGITAAAVLRPAGCA
jgi:hypothetical protein